MEKNLLSIAGLENKENKNELGYGKTKMINECPYYEEISGRFIGDCSVNHLKQCILKQKESYLDCLNYKLSFL